jgi:hypothetical protein
MTGTRTLGVEIDLQGTELMGQVEMEFVDGVDK